MKIIKYIGSSILLIIVVYVNLYKITPLWDLLYYCQSYIFVSFFVILGWKLSKDTLTRSILIALSFYYGYELMMDVINTVNPDLKQALYKKKTINYILALSCGLSLLILPLVKIIKKWILS